MKKNSSKIHTEEFNFFDTDIFLLTAAKVVVKMTSL